MVAVEPLCCHTTAAATAVDINRFTQLLSNHLLLDHFQKAYSQLSKKISFQFRDAIGLRVRKIKSKHAKDSSSSTTTTTSSSSSQQKTSKLLQQPPVDVQMLKRQIRGAVGSFVEDKLPAILTHRYNTTSLQEQIDHLLYQHCPTLSKLNNFTSNNTTVSQHCLLDNRELFLSQIHQFVSNELQSTLVIVNQHDLPRLFEKARAQITGILTHFNLHFMTQPYRLELKLKNPSSPHVVNQKKWITVDMMEEFISTINHTDYEDEHTSIKHFLELSM